MNSPDQKQEKESFVSGLDGTSYEEVNLIILYSVVLLCVRAFFVIVLPDRLVENKWTRFVVEYTVLALPMILITTIFADNARLMFATTFTVAILSILILPSQPEDNRDNVAHIVNVHRSATEEITNDKSYITKEESDMLEKELGDDERFLHAPLIAPSRVPGITIFRSWTTVISCICILAVDFHAFPRRLAKTELYGVGLMDTGVGLFIISNGIVSPEARGTQYHQRTILDKLSHTFNTVLSTWPLWGIGLVRIISIKLIGYQEHVTEYGVHWNFFFTLAAVRILSSLILSFCNISYSVLLSVICIVMYQFVLLRNSHDLTTMILNDDRNGFFMANKEGICSCLGYLALYFASVRLGSYLFKRGRSNIFSWVRATMVLIFTSLATWTITIIADVGVQPISRRLANFAYITWILSLGITCITFVLIIDFVLIFAVYLRKLQHCMIPEQFLLKDRRNTKEINLNYKPPPPVMCLLTAVNRNQFFYFMLSNLSTGLVNIFIDTLKVSDEHAIFIISMYMFINLLIVWTLHMKEISLKFW